MENPALLFGPAVGLLLILLIILRLMGRGRKPATPVSDSEMPSDNDVDGPTSEPSDASLADEPIGNFTIIRRDDSSDAGEGKDEADDTISDEAVMPEWQTVSDAAIVNADRLAAIEQEMLAVRDLYQNEKINKSVYVAETRALFEEAKSLTSD